jgi:hypothetical protein
MKDRLGIDSPRMVPGRSTKVLGKRSVPVELDYSITPGDWDKPLNGVFFWPVHLVWMTARHQQDTFLSWHLAPALEVARGHTIPF